MDDLLYLKCSQWYAKRKVVIEYEERTAKSEYVKVLFDALVEVLKNDPPFLVAVCVTILIFVIVVCTILSKGIAYKYFFKMLKSFFEYLHYIIILVIYMRNSKRISDETFIEINKNIDKKVISIFEWKDNRKKRQKDSPAFGSGNAFKKQSKKHDKENGE